MTTSSKRPALGLYPGVPNPRLYDTTVRVIRARHYSPKTEKSYLAWIRRFIAFHPDRHPRELREPEVNAFLTDLAVEQKLAPSTQSQARAAVLFLYQYVLKEPLDRLAGVIKCDKPQRVPVALTHAEINQLFACMEGVTLLIARLQYGSGVRLSEALSIRVKDLLFEKNEIVVRDGKGRKDRVTVLPESLRADLHAHLREVRKQHIRDLEAGLGRVPMPTALDRKFPNADQQWGWQWVFPSSRHFTNRETGARQRWHIHESTVMKAITKAHLKSELPQHITSHTLRHSFATQMLLNGYDIRTVQELLGHESVKTTEKYLHVLNRGGLGVISPLDGAPPRPRYPEPDKTVTPEEDPS
jgi:integron integrase